MDLHDIKVETLKENAILLIGSAKTSFTFKIENYHFTPEEAITLLKLEKNKKFFPLVLQILNKRAKINFHSIENKVFKNNMILIDGYLPFIVAEMVFISYSSENNSIVDLTNELAKTNSLAYDTTHAHKFYEYKIKAFLFHLAMGMKPNKIWQGEYDTSKQFFSKGDHNELITYNIYNTKQFEDYLFHNTKLETKNTANHKSGTIYKDSIDNCFYMKLNLQINLTSKKNKG